MNIVNDYIPINTKRRSGQKLNGPKFIVIHDTGNDGSTARQNVNYYKNSADEKEASAHVFVDDIEAIWCIPENEKAWHVHYGSPVDNKMFGLDANDSALAIELCYSTKGNIDNQKAYENLCDLVSSLCTKYSLDPKKHFVAHAILDPSRRTDPFNAFSKIGKSWDQFVNDVVSREQTVMLSVPKSKEQIMRTILTILMNT